MRTASGLMLVALGAILTFAVTAHTQGFNLQVAGAVLMITGLVGLVVPRRGYGWLRRRMVRRRGPSGQFADGVEETRYPPYISVNPAADPEEPTANPADVAEDAGIPEDVPAAPVLPGVVEANRRRRRLARPRGGRRARVNRGAATATTESEAIDEYIPE